MTMQHASLHIPAAHPAFDGHFPGQPILPGVVLLDLTQRLIEQANGVTLSGLQVAKFYRPLAPGAEPDLAYRIDAGQVSFTLSHQGMKIADGRFILALEAGT